MLYGFFYIYNCQRRDYNSKIFFLKYCTKTLRVGLLYSKYSYYFACHHSYDGFFLLYLICHFIMKGLINYEYKIYK